VYLVAKVMEDTPLVKENSSIVFQRIVIVENYELSTIFKSPPIKQRAANMWKDVESSCVTVT